MNPLRTYAYLTTSRAHLFDWIRPLTDARYRTEHPIGLGSLARTLHHMKAAEHAYMQRVRGVTTPVSPPAPEDDPEVTTQGAMPFAQLEPAWHAESERTRAALDAVTDWDTPNTFHTEWDGKPYAYRASNNDLFAQLALHEVHHRAQAMHMLKRLGVETGEIDYNALMWPAVDLD